MTKFIVIEKDSLNKATIDTANISLNEASIIHTKMSRDDVAEFVRDGNNLVLKLKNGETIVIEGFFITYDNVSSDLVFEEDGCVLYWFDGTSGFNSIPGLEVLLPEAGSKLLGLLPWLVGAGVIGGVIAATNDNDDKKENIPNGKNFIEVETKGTVTGKTENIPEGADVKVTITGQDKNGNPITHEETVKVGKDGNYTVDIPEEFADGNIKVESEVVDRNGNIIKAEDNIEKTDHDNDPSTPDQGGLDRVDGKITVEVDNKGKITGTTEDVKPGEKVIITVEGFDKDGQPVSKDVEAIVQPDGSYKADVPAEIADGSSVDVEANTTDRNGKPVGPATDAVEGKTDHDNDPSTPDQGGLDRVDGKITVEVDNKGKITGTTEDVKPGEKVIITVEGFDKDGQPVSKDVEAIVQPDGSYKADVPAEIADGSSVDVEANTTDRNGKPVGPATDAVEGKTDHDNDPSTPDQGGLDRVDGKITVEVDNKGKITGTTEDVKPGEKVIITVEGFDKDGQPVSKDVEAIVQPDGSYKADVPAEIADGSSVDVEANTTDRNGKPVGPATDAVEGKTDHDNDPSTPDQGGLDRVDGKITVEVDNKGKITGTTEDVKPGEKVIITVEGFDKDGQPVSKDVEAIVQPDGSYKADVPAEIADGSSVDVEANTTDRNGKPVGPATDAVEGKTDHDNDPSTPDQGGLDRVDGKITVEVDNKGKITGTTEDVKPGEKVIITVEGFDKDGQPVSKDVEAIVQPDGSYKADVPAEIADGSSVDVEANTTDRNGKPVGPATDAVEGKTDHDNDPSTPDQGGLDRVDGKITVEVDNKGKITGTTEDVKPGEKVIITVEGFDKDGQPVSKDVEAIVQPDGSYKADVPAEIADGSSVDVEANTTDRNGKPVGPATDAVEGKTDHDNDPSTPDQGGLDRVDGKITVEVDNKGKITGTTEDVKPGEKVIITVEGFDKDGQPVSKDVEAIVQPDGSYKADVPAEIADGSSVDVEANTTDRNGKPVGPATDAVEGKTDHDNDPSTPDQGGLDRVDGKITVEVDNKGKITGTTEDVKPGEKVIITVEGFDKDGQPVSKDVEAIVQPDGSYKADVPAEIADGSSVDVEANTTDRNGKPVGPATDAVEGKTDHDNDPSTPDQGGLDRVDGKITVEVDNKGKITGTTEDVKPGEKVIITVEGFDKDGQPVSKDVEAIVQPDGSYKADVPAEIADGSSVDVEANTTDRNGKPVGPATDAVEGKTDHDNDPSTPDQGGLDRVDGKITVEVDNKGKITGTTEDVKPGEKVIITVEGFDKDGQPVSKDVEAIVQPDGSYKADVPAEIADGSSVDVEANTTDRNGKPVGPATDAVEGKTDHDNDPSTPDQGGLDRVDGKITVEVDNKGKITGTTEDVKPGEKVIITVEGFDKDGQPVSKDVEAIVQPDGSYKADVPAEIADGSSVDVEANTTDRNGKPVGPATDAVEGKTDHDNDPSTPDQGGLDRVDGKITVEVDNKGKITGTTEDVKPGEKVIITVEGFDKDGQPVSKDVEAIVQPDGSYKADVPAEIADGSSVDVEANTTDRNGKPVGPATDAVEGKTDHDNDPSTPDQGGLDRVDGKITVEVDNKGKITGTTEDVKPGEKVIITVEGFDKDGQPVSKDVEAIVQPDGSYKADVPAEIADGSSVDVEANTTDRNGKPVGPATDAVEGKTDHDNDPSTPDQGGLDRVDGKITVEVDNKGKITGTTEDVKPGEKVIITVEGFDKDGQPVSKDVEAIVQPDGSYKADVPAEIADGSSVDVEANTTDRNGKPVGPATDAVEGKTDHDNDPSTPDQGGLDRVDGKITVEVDNKGKITGTTEDVKPGEKVIITVEGFDKDGQPVSKDVEAIVQPDGSYKADVPAEIADGSSVDVEANTTDRNGKPVGPATDAVEGKTDHDNDPSTPDQGGLDRVDGKITVEVDNKGKITGTTEDVKPGEKVIITVEGFDKDGQPVSKDVEAIVQPDGSYKADVPAEIADGSSVDVEANTTDRNGKPVGPATDAVEGKTDHDNDPSTPDQGGLDRVDGKITVEVDNKGKITGTTEDVKPGEKVIITVEGFDKDGQPVSKDVEAIVQPDGSYKADVPAEIADGSSVDVEANTTDRNGKPVGPATDAVEGKTDHDNDPSTPDQGGLDRVDGLLEITEINEDGVVKGQTTDVPVGSDVVLTFKDHTGSQINDPVTGKPVTVTTVVKPDGSYEAQLPEDLTSLTDQINVKADSFDNNGKPVSDNEDTKKPITEVTTNGNDSLIGTSGNDVLAGDTGGLKTNFVAGANYNVSIVLDLSGSMYFGMDGTRPKNPITGQDDYSPTGVLPNGMLSRLEIAKAGLKAFITQMADHDGVINLQISTFSANNGVGNDPQWDKVFLNITTDNIDEIFEHIGSGKGGAGDGLTAGGGTNPELSFKEATDWFNSTDIKSNGYENQTYYITDGEPNTDQTTLDNAFKPLAETSKVFAVGVSSSVSNETVSRYDNTNVNGDKITDTWNGNSNFGSAQAIADASKLIAYLIGGSENFIPADVGNDVVKGGAGDDILFGDAMNTDWITGLDSLQYPKYSGYSKLIAHLKATETGGAEPTQQQIYDFVKANYRDFIAADAADPATKGGNDTIYGGSGDDIIIAGAGNDIIYGGSGNDIISTGRGDDTIMYDVLNAADAKGGNGTDTWVDYAANDKIEFGADFFEGLLADKSNISEYIKVEDVNGKAVLKVDRDGAADATGGTTHDWADLLIIEGKTASELQDLINNQIIIG
ncbi:BapA/Bap/LapF family prefix-like domain-containing protein [Acinetobacter johnsonii]